MNVERLFKSLIDSNVKLSVKKGKLLCQLPENGIDEDLLHQLKTYKEEIKQIIENTKKSKLRRLPIIKRQMDVFPKRLSYAQQRLWVLDQIEGSTHYNISNALLLEGKLNIEIFKKAFDTIVERHEILRTTYELDQNGEVYQVIQAVEPLQIWQVDLRSLSKEEQDNKIKQIQEEESKLAFDLKNDILLRVKLIQIKDTFFVVLVTMHHIATDGWSIGILIKEFSALYTSFYKLEKNILPELEIQYSDYALWQQEQLSGETLKKLKDYWTNQLSDLPTIHSLPLDYIRPKVQTFEGKTIYSKINVETLNGLKKICDKHGTTLFAGLYSVFTVLLSRYSNERDIVLGTPIANREQLEVANLIGFFVNMLVLRNQLSSNINFVQLINQSKQMLFDAYSNQQMPFDMLVSSLQPERNPSYSSLFQIMFVFQNNEKTKIELPELSLSQIEQSKPFAMYDLSLTIDKNDDGLFLSWEYNTSVFNVSTIKRMSDHFEQLFQSLVEKPLEDVSKINMINEEEKQLVLEGFNQTREAYPEKNTILDLFSKQVKEIPNNIAVKYKDRSYSYIELEELSNQFAAYLKTVCKVVANDFIGIQLERSERMLLSIISILKSGAAYVPIGVDYPLERVRYIVDDTNMKMLINEEEISNFFKVQHTYSSKSLLLDSKPSDLAYCIYTSGSTGVPKGVLNQHSGLFNRLVWMKEYLGVSKDDIFLQKTPYTFDVSVWEFLLPMITGTRLVIAEPEGHKDPEYLKEVIDTEKVNIIHFVPSMFGVFLQFYKNKGVSHIKHIVCSGEELPAQMINQSKSLFTATRVHNFYGPTEAAIDVTAIDVTDLDITKGVSIGKPVANTRIYIVDENLNLQPVGIPGELLISGVQVAKGYLNLEELTKQKFIADPFITGERVYKTGDIAVWEPDGTIKYLGRKDNQVKIRGNRIELGAITSKLLEKSDIKDAIVIVNKKEGSNSDLVAYIVSDTTQNSTELRLFLSGTLSDYEIPSQYIQLQKLPLTSNGKINTKQLPESDFNILKSGIDYISPENEQEKKLVEIFAEELNRNIEEIGTHDNFFDMGANSIKLIKILNKINREFDTEIKPVILFQYPTINDFTIHVLNKGVKEELNERDLSISEDIDSIIDLM